MMLLWINLYADTEEEGIPYKPGVIEDEHFEFVLQKYNEHPTINPRRSKVEFTPYEGKYGDYRVRRVDKNQSWGDAFANNALEAASLYVNPDDEWDGGTVFISKLPEVIYQYKYHYYVDADYEPNTRTVRGVSLTPCLPFTERELETHRIISVDSFEEGVVNGLRISSAERSGGRF